MLGFGFISTTPGPTHQVFEEPLQLLGLILQAERHPLPHFGGCADQPSSHDGSNVLHQDPPVHLAHQRLAAGHSVSH